MPVTRFITGEDDLATPHCSGPTLSLLTLSDSQTHLGESCDTGERIFP